MWSDGGNLPHGRSVPDTPAPVNSDFAEDPINALGHRVRAMIIGCLREYPDSIRAEITAALDIQTVTTARVLCHARRVRACGAGSASRNRARGQWVRYRVNATAVSEVYLLEPMITALWLRVHEMNAGAPADLSQGKRHE